MKDNKFADYDLIDIKNKRQPESSILADALTVLLRNKFLFIFCMIISLTIGYIYIRTTPRMFMRTSTIMVKDARNGTGMNESQTFNDVFSLNTNSIKNEIGIFKSRKLMYKVVERLNLNISYRELNLKKTELYSGSPVKVRFMYMDNNQVCNFIVKLEDHNMVKLREINVNQISLKSINVPIGKIVDTPMGKLIIEIDSIAATKDPDMEILVSKSALKPTANAFCHSLSVEDNGTKSSLLKLSIVDENYLRAEDVLNTLIDTGVLTRYYATILVMITVSIIMATSLNIATGFLGQLVLGHAGFMALGAYSAALTAIALNDVIPNNFLLFLVSAVVAMLVAALAGLIVGTPALRLRGDYLGIMTLGFGEIVKVVLTNLDITNGAQGLTSIPRIMSFPLAYFTMVFIVGFIALFMNSRHGRAMLSIREDEIASESVGINITKYKIIGFVMASMFGGVGGAIYAFQIGFLAPTAFNFVKSIDIFVIVVLGGMGSLTGSIVAAIVLTFLPEALRDFAKYRLLIYSTLLILTMLFRPQGLMGTKEISMSYSSIKMKVVNFPKTIKLKFKQWFKRGDI